MSTMPPDRVVLVHCSASSARQWKALAEELVGFDAVPLDLWGHGDRGRWGGAGPLSLSQEARGIWEACPDGTPFHLVGHSYGGGVALQFAATHPERLRSLTLIEPSCFHILKESVPRLFEEVRTVAETVNRGVICGDYAGAMRTFIDYWNKPGSWENLPDDKRAKLARQAVYVAHHYWSLFEETTPLSTYSGIAVPTLILCGTRSPAPSRAITELLAKTLPYAWLSTIRGGGHMSPVTRPAEVNPLVLDHLSMHATRREPLSEIFRGRGGGQGADSSF